MHCHVHECQAAGPYRLSIIDTLPACFFVYRTSSQIVGAWLGGVCLCVLLRSCWCLWMTGCMRMVGQLSQIGLWLGIRF